MRLIVHSSIMPQLAYSTTITFQTEHAHEQEAHILLFSCPVIIEMVFGS